MTVASALAVLVPLDGDDRTRIPLRESPMTLGRAADNHITVAGTGVSRRHAAIDADPAGHHIRDLDSRNGTFVNGEEVGSEGRRLVDDDVIVLAGSCSFRYLDPQATPQLPRLGRVTGVWIDETTSTVWVNANRLHPALSPHQHELLIMLLEADGNPVSRPDIVGRIWPDVSATGVSDDAVRALVARLKSRLDEAGGGGDMIQVVRGRGIRLVQPDP